MEGLANDEAPRTVIETARTLEAVLALVTPYRLYTATVVESIEEDSP
jgi:hypothetical protein